MNAELDHVAIQVAALDRAADRFRSLGCHVGQAEEFAGEGTREVYVGGDGDQGRLLLIESIGAGPYERSLAKRGPGLHHVAVRVEDVEAYVSSLTGSGWLLHLHSLTSLREVNTVWLARPGVPVLVEVSGGQSSGGGAAAQFVSAVEIPGVGKLSSLLDSLGVAAIKPSPDEMAWLTFDRHRLACSELSR